MNVGVCYSLVFGLLLFLFYWNELDVVENMRKVYYVIYVINFW